MALVDADTYQRVDISHEFEDIRDVIYDVSPTETPLVTNAPTGRAENTNHEWISDALDAVNVNNKHLDGDAFDAEAITPPTKYGNHCQIIRKDFAITRRARKINKAGQRDELARQVVRKGRELKRDMESIALNNQAKVADSGLVAPELAGLPTWITGNNADRGATGADPTGDGSDTKGDGTARALTEDGLLAVTQGIYAESQELPDCLLLDTASKANFSKYMFGSSARIATQYQDQGKSPRGGVQVVGAVDVWVSDYAVIDVVPDRFIPTRLAASGFDAFIYNTGYVDIAYFDSIQTNAMAKTGDTDDRMILADFTLVVRDPATVGTFADIDETAAMVAS